MQNLKTQSLVLFLSTLCLLTGAHAQFTPSDDSNTDSLASKTTNGNKVTLEVVNETGEGATAIDTAFIRFDLTAVPATYTGTSVAKATLKLFVHSVTKAGSFNVNLVNGTWAEATIDYSNQPAIGTTIASNIPLAISNKLDYVEIDITPAVVDWLNGTQANDGIALVPNDPLSATFDSKENTTTSHPAELDIVFNSGGTLTGVTTASGSGLTGGGTSGTLNLSLTPCSDADPILVWNNGGWGCSTVSGGGGGITGSGTPGALPVFNGITSLTSSYVFQNGSNIGIGTTTPQATLDVNGVVNAAISFNIGETPFAFGSSSNQNAFLGFAGNSNISNVGEANTAVGYNSLAANTTGNANTATGNGALLNNTMGGNNMANGVSALVSNTTGNANSASGTQSLFYNTMGSANSASGFKALFNNTTGNNNTALGFTAGNPTNSANTTGSNNTFVGSTANSGTQTNLNNATAIGANAQVTVINALVLGSIFGTNGCDTPCGSVSVGIGTTAPGATLDVEAPSGNPAPTVNFGSASNPATFTVNGNATIAGAGNALFFPDGSKQTTAYTGGGGGITSVTGTNGVNATTSGGAVTVGLASNSCAYGSALSALPFTCFPFATLGLNTFTASQSVMGNITATGVVTGSAFQIGSNLFAFGSYANQNAFLGFAGNTATTGSMNTAVGESSLFNNTTGGSNTAIGYALFANSTGGSNAGVGVNTLNNNTTGSFNSAFGVFAGQVLDGTAGTGLNDTAVGSGAGFGTGTLSNATALGSNSEVNENNALVLGSVNGLNGATSNVNVGIGTATPQFMLDVQGTGNFTGALTAGGGAIFPASPNPGTSGSPSNPLDLTASASNGSTASNQTFRWQAANADGTTPSANLNLLFGSAGATPVATGFSVAPNGTLTAPAIVSTKDLTETIGGNLIEKAAINISQQAGADLSLQSSGNSVDISPAGVTLTGAIVQVQGPTIVTGMTTVQGSLTVTGAVTCGSGCGGGGGSGTVTSVGSGPGLTGGPITSSGTLSIATAGVTNAMLANPSVTISPGTDLMGGGTVALGGTTTLSVNTASLPQLTGGNSFTGNQTVNGNITATTVSADTGFLLSSGGNLPATVLSSNNVAGTNNDVFLGYSAGTFTGSAFGANNIGLGNNTLNALAGGADNTASGYDALHNTSSGGSNTGSGYSALLGNSSGSNNTAVGSFAAEYNTTGSNNTALGYKAGPDSSTPTLNNATAIGAFADVQQPNSLVLGSIANVNGCSPTGTPACQSANVGIGTATPQATLDVEAAGGPTVIFGNASNQAAFTVNGNLSVTGSVTCGSGCGGGGGGVTSVTGTAPMVVAPNQGAVVVSLGPISDASVAATANINPAKIAGTAATLGVNTFTGPQTVNGNLSATGVVTGSIGIGTPTPRSALEVDANVPSGLGPTVTLTNNGGGGKVSLDVNTYPPSTSGTYNPAARILFADAGNYTDTVIFQSNKPGQANNTLQNTMSIDSSGNVQVSGNLTVAGQVACGGSGPSCTPTNLENLSGQLSTNGGVSYTGNETYTYAGTCMIGDTILSINGYGAGALPADGRLLQISQYSAIFDLVGINFGGDGETTFGLPDLRAFAPQGLQYSICVNGIFPSRVDGQVMPAGKPGTPAAPPETHAPAPPPPSGAQSTPVALNLNPGVPEQAQPPRVTPSKKPLVPPQ
jgi:trimeric autotransporter adhesin